MLKDEAKREIVKLWRAWDQKTGKFSVDGQLFHAWLREHHSNLLKFNSAGDQWQVISGWIQNTD